MNSNASATSQTIQERHGSDLKLQDIFLNQCRREHVPVAIHFIDQSVKYGQIIGFDQLCIVLRTNGHQRLAFKSAICMTTRKRISLTSSMTRSVWKIKRNLQNPVTQPWSRYRPQTLPRIWQSGLSKGIKG